MRSVARLTSVPVLRRSAGGAPAQPQQHAHRIVDLAVGEVADHVGIRGQPAAKLLRRVGLFGGRARPVNTIRDQ